MSTAELKARALPAAVSLCHALGLVGRMDGHGCYWVRDPRRPDGGNLTSFSVDTRRGVFNNFAGVDEKGDLIRLVALFATGGDDGRAIAWLRNWLGLGDERPDPREMAELQARQRKLQEDERHKAEKRRAAAFKIWADGKLLDGSDPASLYLKARGIDVLKLPGGKPRALRFAPRCLAQPEGVELPAMLACVSLEGSGTNGFVAVHRTYLSAESGVWVKAFKGELRDGKPVAAKRVLGAFAGGSIRLTRGASGKPLSKAPDGEWIQVAEGIEDALTGALVKPNIRSLAAVSISNMGALVLPKQIGGVYLLKQNDKNPVTLQQFDRAMDKLAERGIEPAIVEMPEQFKDINDALLGKETGA